MKKLMITFMVALFATVVLGQDKPKIKPVQPAIGLGQTKTEIKPGQLPKCISDYVAQHYGGFNIYKAVKIENKGEITYQVNIERGGYQKVMEGTLIFDNNCKLLTIDGKAPSNKSNANTAVKKPTEDKH